MKSLFSTTSPVPLRLVLWDQDFHKAILALTISQKAGINASIPGPSRPLPTQSSKGLKVKQRTSGIPWWAEFDFINKSRSPFVLWAFILKGLGGKLHRHLATSMFSQTTFGMEGTKHNQKTKETSQTNLQPCPMYQHARKNQDHNIYGGMGSEASLSQPWIFIKTHSVRFLKKKMRLMFICKDEHQVEISWSQVEISFLRGWALVIIQTSQSCFSVSMFPD